MNKYITELFQIMNSVSKREGISEFEITAAGDTIEIRRCKLEMLSAVLEFVKKNQCGAELIDGAIKIKFKEDIRYE